MTLGNMRANGVSVLIGLLRRLPANRRFQRRLKLCGAALKCPQVQSLAPPLFGALRALPYPHGGASNYPINAEP